VNELDRELFLSDQQHATLSEALSAGWDDSWCAYLGYALQGSFLCPIDIDSLVVPNLTASQVKVWSGFQRVRFGERFGVSTIGFGDDQDALQPELDQATAAQPNSPVMEKREAGKGFAP
jgi:hypothetical protein